MLVLVAPCHGQPGYGAQTVLRVEQFQEKIDGTFNRKFRAVFFCPAFDVPQLCVEEVDAVFVDAFCLAFSFAGRTAWKLATVTNKFAAFFEAARKFFI